MSRSTLDCAADAVVVELCDGRHVTLRVLGPDDGAALVAALEHADPWDLRRRFMGSPPPASSLVRQLAFADRVHDLAVGAFADGGDLVGVAQFDRGDDRPSAEVAIEVDKEWQRAGLGVELMSRLADLAREIGIHEFTATYYADNVAIKRLLREVGEVTASGYEQGEGYMRLNLDAAS